MANKTKTAISADIYNHTDKDDLIQNILDSFTNINGSNSLPTEDPLSAGALFITGSEGMNLGPITGSGFAILCVSQG